MGEPKTKETDIQASNRGDINKKRTVETIKINRFHRLIATFFHSGYVSKASGTYASALTFIIIVPIIIFGGIKLLIVCTAAIGIIGYFSTKHLLQFTDVDQDPSFVVIDEVLGQMITFIMPLIFFEDYATLPIMYIGGFILFRFFDITKPFHVKWAENNFPGAAGVMLDDLFAGIYASLVLFMLLIFYFIGEVTSVPL